VPVVQPDAARVRQPDPVAAGACPATLTPRPALIAPD